MRVQGILVLLLAAGTSALEFYLVAARGRPIGPPSEREKGPEQVPPGSTGVEIGEQIPSSRAEFLMSSPPPDLPVLRDSVANMHATSTMKSQANASGPMVLLLLRTLTVTSCVGAAAFLFVFFKRRLWKDEGRNRQSSMRAEHGHDSPDEHQALRPESPGRCPATPHPPAPPRR